MERRQNKSTGHRFLFPAMPTSQMMERADCSMICAVLEVFLMLTLV